MARQEGGYEYEHVVVGVPSAVAPAAVDGRWRPGVGRSWDRRGSWSWLSRESDSAAPAAVHVP
eukprot:COSAG01_NODE_5960_length_3933_cov_2.681794_1_plen_63_part_00